MGKLIDGKNRFVRKNSIRFSSILVLVVFLLSICSCEKTENKEEAIPVQSFDKILEDFPWFDFKTLDIDLGIQSSSAVDYFGTNVLGVDDKYVVTLSTVVYKNSGDTGTDSDMDGGNFINLVSVYDRSANKTANIINLNNLNVNGAVDNTKYTDGKLTVSSLTYDSTTNKTTITETDIDPLTGSISGTRQIDAEERNAVDGSFDVGQNRIDVVRTWESDQEIFTLKINSSDGNVKEAVLSGNGAVIFGITLILPMSNTKALICAESERNYLFYILDTESASVTAADAKEYEWLDINVLTSNRLTGTDGKVYFTSTQGVYRVNMETKTNDLIFDYSCCGINRHTLGNFSVAECREDSFLIYGTKFPSGTFLSSAKPEFIIYEFTKASTNPHAGKIVLELYSADGALDDAVADAVIKFNETNKEYFIRVSDRYKLRSYVDPNKAFGTSDEAETYNLSVNSQMNNALAVDLINGKGPDILLNTSSLGQLNNPNYLADLTPYIGTLDPDKYYVNVIEGSKTNGALYQLPVTFYAEGIHTDQKYAGASGVGFTTEEYKRFLSDTLNGKDVMASGQAVYFAKLFDASIDVFIKNGKADFTSPEFAKMASYVKENVPEKGSTDVNIPHSPEDNYRAVYSMGSSISGYLHDTEVLRGATAILGMPSPDGRGPLIRMSRSIAVSAQAKNLDACGEFVKMLLSDEVQNSFAMCDNLVVNREALRQASKTAVEFYNAGRTGVMKQYPESNVDDLDKVILSCSRMASADSDISIILIEEMPAYFTGQKPLADVVKIAQDRVQKVLDERA